MFTALTSMRRLAGIAGASPHRLAGRFLSPTHRDSPSVVARLHRPAVVWLLLPLALLSALASPAFAQSLSFAFDLSDRVTVTGRTISWQLPAVRQSGAYAYALAPATLPAGMTFSAATRQITGTVTAAMAKTEYTYTATNADGGSVSGTFAIEVFQGPTWEARVGFSLATTLATLAVAQDLGGDNQIWLAGEALPGMSINPVGGTIPYAYTLSPATLPAGVTGAINPQITDWFQFSGTPTEAMPTTTYTLTATDSASPPVSVDYTFTITVEADTAPDFGDASVGTRIWPPGTTATLVLPAATGGNGAITYAITPNLPDGLAFDADTRTISGAPSTATAVAEYTLTATDDEGDTGTLTFGIDAMHPMRLRLRLFLEGPLR